MTTITMDSATGTRLLTDHIGGEWVASSAVETLQDRDPATGEPPPTCVATALVSPAPDQLGVVCELGEDRQVGVEPDPLDSTEAER
jgi:hypothetical protein